MPDRSIAALAKAIEKYEDRAALFGSVRLKPLRAI
jgi:hypothetical protein